MKALCSTYSVGYGKAQYRRGEIGQLGGAQRYGLTDLDGFRRVEDEHLVALDSCCGNIMWVSTRLQVAQTRNAATTRGETTRNEYPVRACPCKSDRHLPNAKAAKVNSGARRFIADVMVQTRTCETRFGAGAMAEREMRVFRTKIDTKDRGYSAWVQRSQRSKYRPRRVYSSWAVPLARPSTPR